MKLASLFNAKWKIALWVVIALVVYVPSSYVVPDTYLMEVVSTEVKRSGKETGQDIKRVNFRFINDDNTKGDIFISENEDNWWYIKYKSANLQGEFDDLAKCPGNRVHVRFMGWRWEMLSMFPNVVSIVEVVNPGNCTGTPTPVPAS